MATIIDKVMIALGIDASGMQTGADESGKQIDRVEKKADEAKAKLASIGQSVDDFGKKAGHVLMGFVAPVLAAVSVGKMIGGYFSDVAAVAEATGAYNKTLEETRLKKAQLQRVTKDDIEFYKKSREALVKFNISLADFSAAVMHSIMPAMEKTLGWLDKLTSWVSRNPDNIIRFLKILGTVVGTVLIPVFVRWAAVLLANPITWIVGLVLALALAIDDLVVYLKGGRSSLDSLWKAMGFVKGDTAALAKMIAWLKDTGLSLAKALGVLLTAFTAFKVVTGIINGIKIAWTAFTASVWANPLTLALGLVALAAWMLYRNWDDVCEGAKALGEDVADFFVSWGRGIADGFSALADDIGDAWDSVTDFFAGLIADASSSLSDFGTLCSDKASAAGDAIGTAFSTALDAVGGVWQGMKDGAGAVVDDIETAFSGLTSWFSSLWNKITGVFGSAIDGIKSKISGVAGMLGIEMGSGEEKKTGGGLLTPEEYEKQKQIALAGAKRREAAASAAPVPTADGRKQTVVGGVQAVLAGAGRAQAVRMAPVSSSSFSSVRNSSQTSSVRNDNRRQEVNITINGNADRGTAQQIGDSVTGVFKSGAMAPVQQ
ncbi:hypothetical protein ACR77U_12140 [Enterococcus faecium]|uniref:hypothetical protein n=1 Tax=Enterococcus faecium TaxID=1352 RepID=UPI003DA5E1AF